MAGPALRPPPGARVPHDRVRRATGPPADIARPDVNIVHRARPPPAPPGALEAAVRHLPAFGEKVWGALAQISVAK